MVGLLAMTLFAGIRSLFNFRTKQRPNMDAELPYTLSTFPVNGLMVARRMTAFQTLNAHIISLGNPNGRSKSCNLRLAAAQQNEDIYMSEQAFLSGAPVRERGDMQPMCIEYRDRNGVFYVKALTINAARDILLNINGSLPPTHTFSILNELPAGASYVNA